MTDKLTTAPFQTVPRDYFAYLSGRFARRWWWTLALPFAALAAAAWLLSDLRYAILALMVIFIGFPAIATFVWFGNALSPEARLSSLPRMVEIHPGVKVVVSYPDNPDEPTREIAWKDIRSVKRGRKGNLVILPRGNARDVVIIPRRAFEKD